MVYALRWLVREAGFRFLARRKAAFAVAVLTMALALGANTVVFSALKTFLFASVGVPDADRLFVIWSTRPVDGRNERFSEAYPNFETIRRAQHAFADVALTYDVFTSWDDRGESRPLNMSRVTGGFFRMLDRGARRDLAPVLARQADVLREESELLDELARQAWPGPVGPGRVRSPGCAGRWPGGPCGAGSDRRRLVRRGGVGAGGGARRGPGGRAGRRAAGGDTRWV